MSLKSFSYPVVGADESRVLAWFVRLPKIGNDKVAQQAKTDQNQ